MIERRLRATLPGTVFKRGKRWWWKVQLPGEPREKARSLIPEGERCGVTSLKKAAEVALAMWQRAIASVAEKLAREKARIRAIRRAAAWARRLRQAKREAAKAAAQRQAAYDKTIEAHKEQAKALTQKIQQAEAELDRVILAQKRKCDGRVRACKASAARARERAIAKIRADANKTLAEQRAEFEKKVRAYRRKTTRLWDRKAHQTDVELRTKEKAQKNHFHQTVEVQKKAPRKARRRKAAKAQTKTTVEPASQSPAIQQVAAEYATTQAEIRRESEAALDQIITSIKRIAYCECCFRNGVPEEDLITIDSGQRLCPGCMKALEQKEEEIERQGI
jgi:chromosome segregation ATPase